jgi:hypothetical protein
MMEKELSADLECLQKKYNKDQAAAALQMKDLEDKYSLAIKELSDKVLQVSYVMNNVDTFYFTLARSYTAH